MRCRSLFVYVHQGAKLIHYCADKEPEKQKSVSSTNELEEEKLGHEGYSVVRASRADRKGEHKWMPTVILKRRHQLCAFC